MKMTKHAIMRLHERISSVAPSKKYDRSNFIYDLKSGTVLSAQQTRQKRWKMEVSLLLCSWHRKPQKVEIVLILCPKMQTIITTWISSHK